jgi:hypothetical protein
VAGRKKEYFMIMEQVIKDVMYGNETVKVKVLGSEFGVSISAEGYGDIPIEVGGSPIHLELADGKLMLHVWANANQEDPTHSIDLTSLSKRSVQA